MPKAAVDPPVDPSAPPPLAVAASRAKATTSVSAAAPPPALAASAEQEDLLALEIAHLAKLRAAAGGDPARAVVLADEGHRRFARGVFGQEREAIAIGALSRLGRPEARTRARAFLARHPSSPLADAVRRAAR